MWERLWCRYVGGLLGAILAIAWGGAWSASPDAQAQATQVFARTQRAVIKLSTFEAGAHQASSYGSGFIVDAHGLAITNYHVVSDHLRAPATYALRYQATDAEGALHEGAAQVLAFDLVHDLAVVRTGLQAWPRLPVVDRASSLRRGDALFAVGNPSDLGFTITRGTYSGVVGTPAVPMLHYSGPLNAGMSGGPALDGQVEVVGVNASRLIGGEQLSFLVPASAVLTLLDRARDAQAPTLEQTRQDIARQLLAYQATLRAAAFAQPWALNAYGPYQAPDFLPTHFACSTGTVRSSVRQRAAQVQSTFCPLRSEVEVWDGYRTGYAEYRHVWMRAKRLSDWQFARLVDAQLLAGLALPQSEGMAPQQCRDEEALIGRRSHLRARVVWCAQPYRNLPALYDVTVALATHDRPREALVSRLTVEGVSWDTGLAFSRHFLESFE